MNIEKRLLLLPLLLHPALGQASEKVSSTERLRQERSELRNNEFAKIYSLGIASEQGVIPWLPSELLALIDMDLTKVSNGLLITNGIHEKWVYPQVLAYHDEKSGIYAPWNLADPLTDVAAFRDSESVSESTLLVFLKRKEQIKTALLQQISAEWRKGLGKMLAKKERLDEDTWHEGKAYTAGLLAHYALQISAVWYATQEAAGDAASDTALASPWKAASDGLWSVAGGQVWPEAWQAIYATAYTQVWNAAKLATARKLDVVASVLGSDFVPASYHLSELLSLLWFAEHGQAYVGQVFEAIYQTLPDVVTVGKVRDFVAGAIAGQNLGENIQIEALVRDLKALEDYLEGVQPE